MTKQPIEPEFEWVQQQGDESIRYLEHGAPSPLIRWHYHREYELHLVISTSGKMFVGDYIGNFGPGSLVLTGPDLPHNWISELQEGEQVAIRDQVIQFRPSFIESCRKQIPEFATIRHLLEQSRFGVQFIGPATIEQVTELFRQLAAASGLKRILIFFQMLELLASTDEYRILSSDHHKPVIDKKNMVWLNHAINYIFENYTGNLTQDAVADHMCMKTTNFSVYFKKVSGHRFIDFVNQLRINKACEILAHEDTPITDICFAVGFNNISNFNRRFSDLKGMTPREYRKSCISGLYKGEPQLPPQSR